MLKRFRVISVFLIALSRVISRKPGQRLSELGDILFTRSPLLASTDLPNFYLAARTAALFLPLPLNLQLQRTDSLFEL